MDKNDNNNKSMKDLDHFRWVVPDNGTRSTTEYKPAETIQLQYQIFWIIVDVRIDSFKLGLSLCWLVPVVELNDKIVIVLNSKLFFIIRFYLFTLE